MIKKMTRMERLEAERREEYDKMSHSERLEVQLREEYRKTEVFRDALDYVLQALFTDISIPVKYLKSDKNNHAELITGAILEYQESMQKVVESSRRSARVAVGEGARWGIK